MSTALVREIVVSQPASQPASQSASQPASQQVGLPGALAVFSLRLLPDHDANFLGHFLAEFGIDNHPPHHAENPLRGALVELRESLAVAWTGFSSNHRTKGVRNFPAGLPGFGRDWEHNGGGLSYSE